MRNMRKISDDMVEVDETVKRRYSLSRINMEIRKIENEIHRLQLRLTELKEKKNIITKVLETK